jgi:hypothetical protein
LGNHEFDYRAEGLADSLQAAVNSGDPLPQMVQSNITFPVDDDGNLTDSLAHLKQSMENYGVKLRTLRSIFYMMGTEMKLKSGMRWLIISSLLNQRMEYWLYLNIIIRHMNGR